MGVSIHIRKTSDVDLFNELKKKYNFSKKTNIEFINFVMGWLKVVDVKQLQLLSELNFNEIEEISEKENLTIHDLFLEMIQQRSNRISSKEKHVKKLEGVAIEKISPKAKGSALVRIAFYVNEMIQNNEKAETKENKRFISPSFCRSYMKKKNYTASPVKIAEFFNEQSNIKILEEHHDKHELDPDWNHEMAMLERLKKSNK